MMQYRRSGLLTPMISIAVLSIALSSCSNNNDDTVTQPPSTQALTQDTLFNVQVYDAAGNPVDGATVNITSDPDDIIPTDQENQSTGTDQGGLVTYRPSAFTGEKTLQARASKAGYLSNNIPIQLTKGAAGEASIVITKTGDNSVAGISSSTQSGDVSGGNLEVEAKSGDNTNDGRTKIVIQSDPGATTAEGVPLSNNLNVSVAQYDHDSDQSLDAFPGGFSASIENPADLASSGQTAADNVEPTDGEIIFESAGFTAIEVTDDNGNVAKNFNKPVQVSTKIKDDFKNPKTGQPIKIGDTIPIWSFEASTGKWRYEKTGTVVADPTGGLKVDYSVTHLSYYNLDYFYGARCTAKLKFQDSNGNRAPAMYGRFLSQGWTKSFRYPGDAELTLRNAPANRNVTMRLRTYDGTPVTITNPSGSFNLCSPDSERTVTVEIPEIQYSTLTANVETYCSNDANVPPLPVANSYVWVYSTNRWRRVGFSRTNASGSASFSNLAAGSYYVFLYNPIARRYVRQTITLAGGNPGTTSLRIPQTCTVTTGGGAGT